MSQLPLKPLHFESSLSQVKLARYDKLSTQELVDTLKPGQPGSLKARPRWGRLWMATIAWVGQSEVSNLGTFACFQWRDPHTPSRHATRCCLGCSPGCAIGCVRSRPSRKRRCSATSRSLLSGRAKRIDFTRCASCENAAYQVAAREGQARWAGKNGNPGSVRGPRRQLAEEAQSLALNTNRSCT